LGSSLPRAGSKVGLGEEGVLVANNGVIKMMEAPVSCRHNAVVVVIVVVVVVEVLVVVLVAVPVPGNSDSDILNGFSSIRKTLTHAHRGTFAIRPSQ
jgi:hypothetical protein